MQVKNAGRTKRTIAVLAIICGVLQLALVPQIGLGNGRANMALVFAGCVALTYGHKDGVWCGFFAGLFFDLATTGPVGLMAFLLTACSYILGIQGANVLVSDLRGSIVRFSVAAIAVTLLYHIAMLLTGAASSLIEVIVFRSLGTIVLTVVAFLIFAHFLVRVSPSTGLGTPQAAGRHSRSGRGVGRR